MTGFAIPVDITRTELNGPNIYTVIVIFCRPIVTVRAGIAMSRVVLVATCRKEDVMQVKTLIAATVYQLWSSRGNVDCVISLEY